MSDPITVSVNGREISATKGELLIEVAERAGSFVPRFCYHPRMKPVGICRMCLVEVEGPRGATLQPACFVTVTDGMVAQTETDKVKKAQDGILEFLLANHPLDCPVCDKGGECPLQDQTLAHGSGETRYVEEKRHFAKPVPIGELVLLDRERCIQCARCTRFASEVAGEAEIDFAGRGEHIEVAPFPTEPFDSVFSGNTVQICPVGALTAKPYRFAARPWDLQQVETSCTTCALQCRVAAQSSADRLTRVLGVDSDAVNHGWLCDKGRFGIEAVTGATGEPTAPGVRLGTPLVRHDGVLVGASWNEALAAAAAIIKEATAHSPDGLGVIGGASLTNEGIAAWRHLIVDTLGVPHVDPQYGDGLDPALVLALPRATIDDMASARVVITLCGDLREELPVLYLRLRDGVNNRSVALVDIATLSRPHPDLADVTLAARPGEVHLLARALTGDDAAASALATHPQGMAVTAADLALARALVLDGDGVVVVLGRANLAEDPAIVEVAARSLAAAMPKARFLPALRRSNVMGALELGWFPGAQGGAGRDTAAQLAALTAGEQRALILLGGDLSGNVGGRERVRAALAAGHVIAVTGHGSIDLENCDVVLPALVDHERFGTVTNIEGRVTDVQPKVSGPGSAWPDVAIVAELAAALGDTALSGEVTEVARVIAAEGHPAASVLARPSREGALPGRAPSTTRRPMDPIAFPGVLRRHGAPDVGGADGCEAAAPRPLAPAPAPEVPLADAYALRVVASRRLYDTGATVWATPALAPMAARFVARAHPYDLDRLGATTGDTVRLVSARGSLTVTVEATDGVTRGTIEVPAFAVDGEAFDEVVAARTGPVLEVRMEST